MCRSHAAIIVSTIVALAQTSAWAVPPGTEIVNTATGTYGSGGVAGLVAVSNEVTVTVAHTPTLCALDMLVCAASNPSAESLPVPPTFWSTTGDEDGPFALSPVPWNPCSNEPIDLTEPVPLVPTGFFNCQESVFVRVTDGDENRDPLVVETVLLTAGSASTGDRELLRLTEIAADAGVFVGYVRLTHASGGGREHDGLLSVGGSGSIYVSYEDPTDPTDAATTMVPVDPSGHVFDSRTGMPLDGAVVTLVDADTESPATVYSYDGESLFPATLITGGQVTDSGGVIHELSSGEFRFPSVLPGRYRLAVSPPQGYDASSTVPTEELPEMQTPGHGPVIIEEPGSRGEPFVIVDRPGFCMDYPVDPVTTDAESLFLTKSATRSAVSVGDFLRYDLSLANLTSGELGGVILEDLLPLGFRYQAGSATVVGQSAPDPAISRDGRTLMFELGQLSGGEIATVGYVVEVAAGAKPGAAVNSASAEAAGLVTSNTAVATVEVREDLFRSRGVIVGRVTEPGGLSGDAPGYGATSDRGVAGVRIYLEDGTSVVTDRRGMYHFEGVPAGSHVVQLDLESLPAGYDASPEKQSSRFAGRACSQFLDLAGGALGRADFRVEALSTRDGSVPGADHSLASVDADYSPTSGDTGESNDPSDDDHDESPPETLTPGLEWVSPEPGQHPHIPSVRLEVKHDPAHRLSLSMNGNEVSRRAFDGTVESADGTVAVTRWSGVDLDEGDTRFVVTAVDGHGAKVGTIERTVHYSGPPVHAELIPGESLAIADGRSAPTLAVRLTDRDGHPARTGVLGTLSVDPPYAPLRDRESPERERPAGVSGNDATFTIEDRGMAFVRLEPTSTSGEVVLRFHLENGEHELRAWLRPEERDWILVGLAEGTLGYRTVAGHAEALNHEEEDDYYEEGRVVFFARGMVPGRCLLTLSYDSERSEGDEALFRTVDPDAYYTLYGDATEQTADAPSTGKLYVRLEREQFYALHGDYVTGLTVTELSRYSRAVNGFKSGIDTERVGLTVFASETNRAFVRDEIRGDGTSGLYRLSRRCVAMNSESVSIETRDRLGSNDVLTTRVMTRHRDYDIDYGNGTLFFMELIPSRDAGLNPVYVVVDYESDEARDRSWIYGGRAAVRFLDRAVEVGSTYVSERHGNRDDSLVGADATVDFGRNTTLVAEFARSEKHVDLEPVGADAYLVELRHRSGRLDGRAYARKLGTGFGLGHQNAAEAGTRKLGIEVSHRFTEMLRLSGQAYRRYDLTSDARRDVGEADVHLSRGRGTLRAGFRHAEDALESGAKRASQQLTTGGSYRVLGERMLLRVDREQSLPGMNANPDFPTRTTAGADYRLAIPLTLFAEHELSEDNERTSARTRAGAKARPWSGGQVDASLGRHYVERADRIFANLGVRQTWRLRENWNVDVGLEDSRTLSGTDSVSADPAGLGGPNDGGDFTAMSLGVAYHGTGASWNSRVEHRSSSREDRLGVVAGVHGEPARGLGMSLSARILTSSPADLPDHTDACLRLGLALRPERSTLALLCRIDLILEEDVGEDPDCDSGRVVGNASANWSPGDGYEVSAQYGARYTLTDIDGVSHDGYTDLVGLELRKGVGERWDVGVRGSTLHSWNSRQFDYYAAASVGYNIVDNAWLGVGYSFTGFEDQDFAESGHSERGPFVRLRIKFDQETARDLAGLLARF
ncbi:MAG: hypothetical protein ABIK85_03515 [Candidatus Eisenbacteria bacterium]